jgi:hypothetical protein
MIAQRGVGISMAGSLNPGGFTLHSRCQRLMKKEPAPYSYRLAMWSGGFPRVCVR